MARSIRLLKADPDPHREPGSRARYRAEHVTVGVMMTPAERDALAILAAAAGFSMGSRLGGDSAAREAELQILRERSRREGMAEGWQGREAEVERLRRDLAAATAAGEARVRAVAAAWRAAFQVECDAMGELRAVVVAWVSLASYHPDGTGQGYLQAFEQQLEAQLRGIPEPPGSWPKA